MIARPFRPDVGRPGTPATRVRVLVAEDDDELRSLLSEVLVSRGYDVVEIASGSELESFIDDCVLLDVPRPRVHFVVSDIQMPGADGLSALAHGRDVGWELPTLIISAFGNDDTEARALELGACAYLSKPVDFDQLVSILREATQLSR